VKKRQNITIMQFTRENSQPWQGTNKAIANVRITVVTKRVLYPEAIGCCSPVFVPREINTIKLARREYVVEEGNKYIPLPHVTLSRDDHSAARYARKMRQLF
jgi:hypothetical protein